MPSPYVAFRMLGDLQARAAAVRRPREKVSEFMRDAVEREIERRERLARRRKPTDRQEGASGDAETLSA